MYTPYVPALPGPTMPALPLGPPVGVPPGRMMFRVLDQRCHWLPDGRQYSGMDGSSTSRCPEELPTSGRRMSTIAVELGQSLANTRDCWAPTAAGKDSDTMPAPP